MIQYPFKNNNICISSFYKYFSTIGDKQCNLIYASFRFNNISKWIELHGMMQSLRNY